LRGGAARSGGPGGLRVDGSARALTRLPAGVARVGALTPTAAAVSAVALGRRCPRRLVRPCHQPEANGLSALPVVQVEYRKHLRPIYQSGFYTGRMAAALLDVRTSQPGTGPLGVPDLRFGGQL
jgi:hypothetical protein